MISPATTVILVNLGTPSEPTTAAVKQFLKRFLSDRRVVSLPAWLWQPLLQGVILPIRSKKVAGLYQRIWLDAGSPLQVYSERLAAKVAAQLSGQCQVRLAMSYSEPSIESVVQQALADGCERLLVLPLYPQYSVSTTAPVFDALARSLKTQFALPAIEFIRQYYDFPGYCELLAARIRVRAQHYDASHPLVFSFHGIPERYARLGDPYPQQCQQTARRVAELLGLDESAWKLSYQSRFGKEPWLTPYTDQLLSQLVQGGATHVDVISPAFSVDCLETLEEISGQLKELFIGQGGESFHYIEALNDGDDHAQLLCQLIGQHLCAE